MTMNRRALEAVVADGRENAARHGAALAALRGMVDDWPGYLETRWRLTPAVAEQLISHARSAGTLVVGDPPIPSPPATVYLDAPGRPYSGLSPAGYTGASVTVFPAALTPGLGAGYDDATAINWAFQQVGPHGVVNLVPGLSYTTYSPIVIPAGCALVSPVRGFGIPDANYGLGGLPVIGTIIEPSAAFSGSAVLSMSDGGVQSGGQQIRGLTIDGSLLPAGNTVHGIQAVGAVAAVTLRDILVYGGNTLGGNGLDVQKGAGSGNPDFWDVAHCKFSGVKGIGAHLVALADSYFVACESTGNTGDSWNITNGNNSRYVGCKAEGSGAGFGWNLIGTWGAAGYSLMAGCTSSANTAGGVSVSGAGTGTWYFDGCHITDTTPWTYAGTNGVKSSAAFNTSTAAPTLS